MPNTPPPLRRPPPPLDRHERLRRLEVATEGTGEGLWDWDLASDYLWVSAELRGLLGRGPRDEWVPADHYLETVHPADRASLREALEGIRTGSCQRFQIEVRVRHAGGNLLWVLVRGSAFAQAADGTAARIVGTMKDVTARRTADDGRSLLLALSDLLLQSADPAAAITQASAMLGRFYGVSRVAFAELDDRTGAMTIRHEWNDGTVPPLQEGHNIRHFGRGKEEELRAGRTVAIADVSTDARCTGAETLAAYAELGARAVLNLPLIRHGQFEAMLCLHHRQPRAWTEAEVALAENARNRIWEAVIREQAEERLRESERRLRYIFDLTPTIPWVLDGGGELLAIGDNWTRMTGLSITQSRENGWLRGFHPDDQEEAARICGESFATGAPLDLRGRMRAGVNGWRWVRCQGACRRDNEGRIIRWYGYISDIQAQVEAEDALRASEAQARKALLLLERVLETAPDPIWVKDMEGRFVTLNSACASVIGQPRERLIGGTDRDWMSPDHVERVEEELSRILGQGETVNVEERLLDDSSQTLHLYESHKVPLRDDEGQVFGMVGFARDITRRKEVEVRLQAIVDTAVDAIVVINECGIIESANPSTHRMFQYQPAEMIGLNVSMLMPGSDARQHDGFIRNYRTTGQRKIIGIGRQVLGRRKDGSTFPLDLSIAEWLDVNGRRHFTGIMRDATPRIESEARLQRAHETLLSVSRLSAAGAMASTLAHELNQPLTAASNLLRIARRQLERGAPEQVSGFLEEAGSEVLRAGSIIRRMREYTINGELDPSPQSLTAMAEAAVASVERRPEAMGVEIVRRYGDGGLSVLADRIQIEQVLANILRNACEALVGAPRRVIKIGCRQLGEAAELSIHDSGPGLSDEQMERLFQPFATSKEHGTGLGLAISRTIVEAHGGQISAANHPEGGALFTILLPMAPAADEHPGD